MADDKYIAVYTGHIAELLCGCQDILEGLASVTEMSLDAALKQYSLNRLGTRKIEEGALEFLRDNYGIFQGAFRTGAAALAVINEAFIDDDASFQGGNYRKLKEECEEAAAQ